MTTNGRYITQLEEHPNAAVLIPTRVAATTNGPAFDMLNADVLSITQKIHAALETAMSGAQNDIAFVAKAHGAGGTGIRIAIVVSGNNTALSVSVSTNDITINSATDGSGVATSTAAQVIAAIVASAAANALVHALLVPGNDGTGVVAAFGLTALAVPSGTTPTLDQKFQTSPDGGTTWQDTVTFSQIAAALSASGAAKVAGPFGQTARLVSTLGGTTPIYYYSISAKYRP